MSSQPESVQFTFPAHGDAILSKMNALREERCFCDITLLLGFPLGTAAVRPFHFHGHKVVLAASSNFLRDQFFLNEGQAELKVTVVTSVEVGQRLLLSCYTGLLEVPLTELVSYLTAASALQMSHVVEKCAQAISHFLSPTLAHVKLENLSKEEEIQQPDGGWTKSIFIKQEQRNVIKHPTFIRKADIKKEEGTVTQSLLESHQGAEVTKSDVQEAREDTVCCLKTLESEMNDIIPFKTISSFYKVDHFKDALKCKLHDATAFTKHTNTPTRKSPIPDDECVDSSQDRDDEKGELNDQHQTCTTAPPMSEPEASYGLGLPGQHQVKCHSASGAVTGEPDSPLVQPSYLCRRCDRVFQHLENYVKHLKEHKHYLCLVCERSFSQRSNLTRHIRVHTGVKPFRCPLCHKTFSQKASLQDHLNLHTGDKPHKCNYCAVHFAHKPGLRRHLKDIHCKSILENVLEEAAD